MKEWEKYHAFAPRSTGKEKARAVVAARTKINKLFNEKDISADTQNYYMVGNNMQTYQIARVSAGWPEHEKDMNMAYLEIVAKALVATAFNIYLITGVVDYIGLEVAGLDPGVTHTMYTNAFIAYAGGHIFFDLLPKLVKTAWKLIRAIWSIIKAIWSLLR